MIYINASILDDKPSGLGIYTKNVICDLNKINKKIKVFSPVKIKDIDIIKITKYVKTTYKKFGGLTRFLWTQFVLPFKVKKDDIIYHPFQYLSIFSKAKQVFTIHDLIPMYYPQVAKHQYFYYKYIMPILLKKASKVVCISNNTKNDILKFYDIDDNKIEVIYNGYDSKLFNVENVDSTILNKYNIDYKYLMMIGPSYEHKNMHFVIEAFSKIKDDINCNLLIIGKDSNYKRRLIDLVKKENLKSRVKFLGYVDINDLPSIYGCAECLIYPSLYEGFGFPIVESMACGTKVICANTSCLPEVGGNSAIYFDINDKEDLKIKIKENLKISNIGENFDNCINKFSWENAAKKIYKLLNGLIIKKI